MDYIDGQTITIGDKVLEFRNYTLADLSDFNDWTIHSDYGFELSIPSAVWTANRVQFRNWFEVNGFIHTDTVRYHDGLKWMDFESRAERVDLAPIIGAHTFIVRWHIGDIGLFIGRRDGILWIEELSGVGSWQSVQEMFAY
jgi:hypothetical protein